MHRFSKDTTTVIIFLNQQKPLGARYHQANTRQDRYYLSKSAETAWCKIPSGEYEAGFKAKLTAVSQNSNAKLVYTTDGTDPTAKS